MLINDQLLKEHIDKISETCDSIVKFINYQILGNADSISYQLQKDLNLDSNSKKQLDTFLDTMIKSPLRRQVSRLNNLIPVFKEINASVQVSKPKEE